MRKSLHSALLCLALCLTWLPGAGTEEPADIYLNFENTSLASIVNYLAEQKKINLIPNKKLEQKKVSLTTREPLTLTRAWNILQTLLETNGFSIINVDGTYRIVENKLNQKEPLPFYSALQGTEPKDLPDNDTVVRYVYILKNIATTVADKILMGLLGRNKFKTNKDLSSIIITDKCLNIKAAMKIIEELDKGGMRESIKIIKLKHTSAKEVADMFMKKIFERPPTQGPRPMRFIGPRQQREITYFSSTTKIIPEPRQNALILLGLQQHIDRVIEFINKYIDVPMGDAASRIHIKELQYVEAPTVKKILDTIIKHPGAKPTAPLAGEFKFFEDVNIQAERAEVGEENSKVSKGSGNRLIVSCGKDDWLRLEKLINKIDKPQPQVAIEIMVVDIDDNTQKQLGVQIQEKMGKSFSKGMNVFTSNLRKVNFSASEEEDAGKDFNPASLGGIIDPELDKVGSTMLTIGARDSIWSVIKSYFAVSHTNIISQPFLVTSNNEECIFKTQITRQVLGKITTTKDNNQQQQVETVQATTQVTITPRINLTGLIDLKIKISLSEFLAGPEETPPRSNRKMETRASMATGEVLVLGGLTRSRVKTEAYKSPLLSNVPIIGNLFKNRTKDNNKTNLYIFLRPSIIKPRFEGGPDEYTNLKLAYAKRQIFNAEELHQSKDPIQRWFFKPDKERIGQKLDDLKKGIYRPIDDYAQGKKQPTLVRIERDPYFRAEEEIKKERP